jgi:hypothetical protein
MNVGRGPRGAVYLAALLLVSSCGGGDPSSSPLVIRLADGPVDDALAVVVSVEGLDLDSFKFDFSPPLQVDLLAYSDGRSLILFDWPKSPTGTYGTYDRVRLRIRAGLDGQDSWIDTPTGRHALWLPEANQGGLSFKRSFDVPDHGRADFTIDFDLRQSIIPPGEPGGPYVLDPVLRMVNTLKAGSIGGVVASATAQAPGCVPVVYAFAGRVVPDDIDRVAPDPVTEGTVRLDPGSGEFRYVLAHLPSGNYTVALTCQGHLDRPDRDDSATVSFGTPVIVAVASSQQARVDFP